MNIRVIISGIRGKMGRITEKAIDAATDLELIAGVNRQDDLAAAIQQYRADVVVDFTTPDSVFHNTEVIINNNARPVIGTSGLENSQITQLQQLCSQKHLGGIIAPNFSLGAVLMMKFAAEAAHYFDNVEIIEMHHTQKLDAPSGTAIKTAQMITASKHHKARAVNDTIVARGDHTHGIAIHSVRLPGLFSQQHVIFAADGESLSIRHDGTDRQCCMPGVLLCCRQVMQLKQLIYGMEHIL